MKIIEKSEIIELLNQANLLETIENGFVEYSRGNVVVPPVGEMSFDDPPGDCHIKYGYIRGDEIFVIKVAQGFYDNPKIGLPSTNGLMIVSSQKTGEILAILLDEGYLTDVRTAVAGAVVAKHLAPKNVKQIGIIGTGVQARLQLKYLQGVVPCRNVIVWGRSISKMQSYKNQMQEVGFNVKISEDISEVVSTSNLIVTCTPSLIPLVKFADIQEGTHITAIGSDTTEKQELESAILNKADVIVVDSIEQSQLRGEVFQSSKTYENLRAPIELGNLIADPSTGRTGNNQITIADLTGVAIQDIQISKAVLANL